MLKFNSNILLSDMYEDSYFPNFLVDKIKKKLEELILFLEIDATDINNIQNKCDEITEYINSLEEEFDEQDSELETVARESIAESIYLILDYFKVNIDIEEAIRNREW